MAKPGRKKKYNVELPADAGAALERSNAQVRRILERPVDDPPARSVRWLLAPVSGPAFAHAMIVGSGAAFTLCKGFRVEGSVYPPPEGLPRCPTCEAAVELARKIASDEAAFDALEEGGRQ
jgi:hypothetical protein